MRVPAPLMSTIRPDGSSKTMRAGTKSYSSVSSVSFVGLVDVVGRSRATGLRSTAFAAGRRVVRRPARARVLLAAPTGRLLRISRFRPRDGFITFRDVDVDDRDNRAVEPVIDTLVWPDP